MVSPCIGFAVFVVVAHFTLVTPRACAYVLGVLPYCCSIRSGAVGSLGLPIGVCFPAIFTGTVCLSFLLARVVL